MSAPDELCILRGWRGHLVPRSLEAVARWLDHNRGPTDKPEGEDNTPNLIWLATPSESASGVGHPKFSASKGFDFEFTHGAFFDVDGPASTVDAFGSSIAALERAGYGAVYSRSYNASDVDPWRGHVQLVFHSPCPAHVHARVWKQLHREIFPLVQRSQHSPVRGRNAPKPGAGIEVLPGALIDWHAVLERSPDETPEPELPHVTASAVQLSEHDGELAESLAALWQLRTTGERAFGALGGWLYRRGVGRERALGIAARVSELTGAVGGHAERRVHQAYDGDCPLGRPALLEALGQDGGRQLGGGSGLASPEVLVACELDRLEDLIAESTRESPAPEPEFQPSPTADPFSAWRDVVIDDRSRSIMLATRVPRRETGDWSAPPQEPAWVCKGLLLCPEARAHIVAAYPNGGKTWFVTELARAVSTGTAFGGHFPTRKGRVLGLEFEEDRHEHNEKRQMLSLPVSSPLASPDWIVLHAGDPELRALTDWDAIFGVQRGRDGGVRFVDMDEDLVPLVALIDGFDLVTVDSLRSVSGSFDENTKFASRPLQRFRRAAQLCRHSFPTVVFIHHASKTSLKSEIRRSQRGQPSKDFRGLTSGTTALEGDAGNIWLLDPDPSEDFLTQVHHARKSRGPKQPSFAARQTYDLSEPTEPVDLPRPVTHYQIESDASADSRGAAGREVTDVDVIREALRYLWRARATHDGECRSLKAMTPSVVAQLDPARGSVESRELRQMKPAALAKLIEQVVRANEGRLCVAEHEPGALEGRPLLGTLRLRAGSSRPGWWLELEAASVAAIPPREPASPVPAVLVVSKARPGSPEARTEALCVQLAAARGAVSGEPLGLMYLPPEYDRPRRELTPQRRRALELLDARGVDVLHVNGINRAVLVNLAVLRRQPWAIRSLARHSEAVS
jgi:hypothetical protein